MVYKVQSTQEFKSQLKKMNKDHLKIIEKMINKLEIKGANAFEFLDREGHLVLGEVKRNRPPYRLYIIKNQKNNIIYLLLWAEKNKQKRIIKQIQEQMKLAVDIGVESIFGSID